MIIEVIDYLLFLIVLGYVMNWLYDTIVAGIRTRDGPSDGES